MRSVAGCVLIAWLLYSCALLGHLLATLSMFAFTGIVINPLGLTVGRAMAALGLWFVLTAIAGFMRDEVDR